MPNLEQVKLMMHVKNEVLASLPDEKCRRCPAVLGIATQIAVATLEGSIAKEQAEALVDSSFDELGVAAAEVLGVPADLIDAEIRLGRQLHAEKLDTIDSEIDRMTKSVLDMTVSCSGILKMRATRDDTTYTTTICTSPEEYRNPSPGKLHVAIIQRNAL